MTALPGQHAAAEERAAAPAQAAPSRGAQAQVHSRWTDEARWRRRALRLLGVWVLLSLLLVGLRVATASIRPELRAAQIAQEELVKQRDTLSLEVQSLGSAGRITAWAEEQGMLRFADSLKRSAELSGVTAPEPSAPPKPVQLNWQWSSPPAQPEHAQPEPAEPKQETP